MDVANYITRHSLVQFHIYQTFVLRKVLVRAKYNLPNISLRQRFAIFEPLNHILNKLLIDTIFPILVCEFWPCVGFIDLTPSLNSDISEQDS